MFLSLQTRILVTHSLTYLSQVDEILVMNDGKIIEQGSYEKLINRDGHLAKLMRNHETEKCKAEDDSAERK